MLILYYLLLGGITAVVGATFNWDNATSSNTASIACEYFKKNHASMTLLPSDSEYEAENQVSWNAGAWLGPACILLPSCAEGMSVAVKNLIRFKTPFAMRGGGHMTIPTAANINSTGILISSTNLKTLKLSEDEPTLSIGPGHRWGDAYTYLNGTGKMVVGGRYAPVGVPGYLLGGGMSFFSYEYGFSSTNGNVQAYECVLANGTVATVTATNQYSDLFWSLQGGGNSFCLVATFTLRTFDHTGIGLANPSYGFGTETKDRWLNSILNYVLNGSSDPKAAIIPVARFGSGSTEPRYDATLMYNSPNTSLPAILSDFQGGLLPASNLTALAPTTMADFGQAVLPAFKKGGESHGLHQKFHVVSHAATREAMDVVHDTFFSAVKAQNLGNLTDFFVGLAWNSITTKFIEASNSGIGCPQGVKEEPVFWVEEAFTWGNAEDDTKIEAFVLNVNKKIKEKLEAIEATRPYIYMNDADNEQNVFGGYPVENVRRLKEIRRRYDPERVYTDLMPGGFKIDHVNISL